MKTFIPNIRLDDAPLCCGKQMDRDGEVNEPARGRMTFYKCSVCGAHQMIFKPVKKNQQLALCGECKSYYRKGCFASKEAGHLACELFQEEI